MRQCVEQLRKNWVYVSIIWKRMWKTPGYLLAFLLVPIVILTVYHISKGETEVRVAVYIEGIQENIETEESDCDSNQTFHKELRRRLEEREGTIHYSFCNTKEEVKQEVAVAKAECGFIIPRDLLCQWEKNQIKNSIECFISPQTSMQTICQEAFFAELFLLYEEYTFPTQAMKMFSTGEHEEEGTVEIAKLAEELFFKYRYNGSTFQFEYETYVGDNTEDVEGLTTKKEQEERNLFSIRGMFAFVIYICALCGTLDALEDENAKRTHRMKQRIFFSVLTICMPAFVMSVLAVGCFWLTGTIESGWKEVGAILLYQMILLGYCMILKKLFKREEIFATAMSMLILLTAVVCPVFVDLSQFVPAFELFEKMFPVHYYLNIL